MFMWTCQLIPGACRSRCGSLANIAYPVVVFRSSITQLLLPENPEKPKSLCSGAVIASMEPRSPRPPPPPPGLGGIIVVMFTHPVGIRNSVIPGRPAAAYIGSTMDASPPLIISPAEVSVNIKPIIPAIATESGGVQSYGMRSLIGVPLARCIAMYSQGTSHGNPKFSEM